ncbi:MAG: DUF805 domain-containing protein [Alphaproteobacteria bacterium]|nr:DUF805 domain-containing protein [Alphaproteobacteria bacterium]OJV46458.1 MAG: hypothetical protein BGO28_02630 [Alphaproteobacteria bacterium 43-37]
MDVIAPRNDAHVPLTQESRWTKFRRQTSFFYKQGRLNRTNFILAVWGWSLAIGAAMLLVGVFLFLVAAITIDFTSLQHGAPNQVINTFKSNIPMLFILGAGGVIYLVLMASLNGVYICLFIRRLHDFNFSGLWVIPVLLLQLMAVYISIVYVKNHFIVIISLLISVILGYAINFIPGANRINKYGSPEEGPKTWKILVACVFVVINALFQYYALAQHLKYL